MATAQLSSPSLSVAYSSGLDRVAFDSSRRIPALDGLRGIAILLVLLRHGVFGLESTSPTVNKLLSFGQLTWSGVDLFFVLSGFLIGGILLDARESPNYYKTFYLRRAYRILPLYYALTAVFLFRHLLPVGLLPGILGRTSPLTVPAWSYFTFTQTFFMVHLGWFGPPAMTVAWSLAVEEQFYLAAPLLIRNTREGFLFWTLVITFLAVPFVRLAVWYGLVHGAFACYVLTPCRADALCLGVLCALLVRRKAFWKYLLSHRNGLWVLTGFLFAGMAFMTLRGYTNFSLHMAEWGYSCLALFYACCLLLAVSSMAGVWHGLLCQPWLMRLGTLAYCVYLLHFPLNTAARYKTAALFPSHPDFAFLAGSALSVIAAIGIAMLSWKFFEKPMLRRGHKYQY